MSERILYNALRTPDGTVLESFHRHDYQEHIDSVTGKLYMTDGGTAYLRRTIHKDQVDLSQYFEEGNHEHNRKYFHWGTYGKNGDQPLKYINLESMETAHIEAILETQFHISQEVREIFETELEYREH